MKDLLKSINPKLKHFLVFAVPYAPFLLASHYVHSLAGAELLMFYGWLAIEISLYIADKITGAKS